MYDSEVTSSGSFSIKPSRFAGKGKEQSRDTMVTKQQKVSSNQSETQVTSQRETSATNPNRCEVMGITSNAKQFTVIIQEHFMVTTNNGFSVYLVEI